MSNKYSSLMHESQGLARTLVGLAETINSQSKDISDTYSSGAVDSIPYSDMPLNLSKGFVMFRTHHEPGKLDLFMVKAMAGSTLPAHQHSSSVQSIIVISGTLEVCVEGEKFVLLPHGAKEILEGQVHSLKAVTDCLFIKFFRPPLMDTYVYKVLAD